MLVVLVAYGDGRLSKKGADGRPAWAHVDDRRARCPACLHKLSRAVRPNKCSGNSKKISLTSQFNNSYRLEKSEIVCFLMQTFKHQNSNGELDFWEDEMRISVCFSVLEIAGLWLKSHAVVQEYRGPTSDQGMTISRCHHPLSTGWGCFLRWNAAVGTDWWADHASYSLCRHWRGEN